MRGIESGKAMYQENMENELATLRARLTEVENKEAERWAQRLNWLHTEYGADCSGVDSGDPLDCVEVEIRQVVNRFSAALAEMTERARVLGEAALKIHKRSRYERCHAPDTYSCAGNQLACDDCEYNDCGCPACTIAREVVKENS